MYKTIPFLLIFPFTVFFINITASYLLYFDIGINNFARYGEIYWIRTPTVILAQVITVFLGNRFCRNIRWNIVLHFALLFVVICLVFTGFAIMDMGAGIPRQGGFIRFLGYYFLNFEPGKMPDGTW
jgi:uncharacterized membrane protein